MWCCLLFWTVWTARRLAEVLEVHLGLLTTLSCVLLLAAVWACSLLAQVQGQLLAALLGMNCDHWPVQHCRHERVFLLFVESHHPP